MSIDISVVVWTVVGFCVFMLLLNRFLFKPMLRFMDDRQKRIDDARAALQRAEAERLSAAEEARREREQSRREEIAAAEARLEELRSESKANELRFEKESGAVIENSRAELELEKAALVTHLGDDTDRLIGMLADRLLAEER
ncbi:MAG: ATP synthase F0 subunit B [Oscillospiraceae bacterium]|nr:ATP synthase F0 subunit B [Oscillospiraceae bacterium]